jgi:hypothetical protein
MAQLGALEALIQHHRRTAPFAPARIGRHDVLIETFTAAKSKTFVYRVRHGRVVVMLSGPGYREDLAVALLDAVDDLVDSDDLGSAVHLRPIAVDGVPLDRAALFGPGHTQFFAGKPDFSECGLQLVPVHSSEFADGDSIEGMVRGRLFGKALGIDEQDWSRDPVPAARILRLDNSPGGRFRPTRRAKTMKKPVATSARGVFERDLPELFHGPEEISVQGVHGQELRLRRRFDRLQGTLHLPGHEQPFDVDVPREAGWEVFGPLFRTGRFDPDVLAEAAARPAAPMLELRVDNRYRSDYEDWPTSLDAALLWIEKMEAVAGHSLLFRGRSGGCVQMMWQDDPSSGGRPALWVAAPRPEQRRSSPARIEWLSPSWANSAT